MMMMMIVVAAAMVTISMIGLITNDCDRIDQWHNHIDHLTDGQNDRSLNHDDYDDNDKIMLC
jgi:hypothetical protein